MKYNAPPGEDLNAPYLDGNRNAGIKGSVVPGAAVEFPQRELAHLIGFAGLTPDNGDLEQVRKAVQALIAAATGGGDTSQFLLVSQARARLPIFPEVLSADGRINVLSPAAGSVQVPTTVSFLHRGIFPVSTSDYSEPNRTFATQANKTFHLRWDATNGFRLRDLANAGYNPGVLAESNAAFDSTYDDMLVARVTTNGSNVATITNLANRNVLAVSQLVAGVDVYLPAQNGANFVLANTLNWARTPNGVSCEVASVSVETMADADRKLMAPGVNRLSENALGAAPVAVPVNRYGLNGIMMYDCAGALSILFNARA